MSRNALLDDNEEEDAEEVTLHERLRRVWRNERCAPTLLHYETELMEDVHKAIEGQEECMQDARQENTDGTTLFMIALLELEIDRFRFLVRSYLRCRLHKVQKFNQFLLSSADRIGLMSDEEVSFCKNYTDMMQAHYNASFLDKVPLTLRDLNKPELTAQPPVHNHVFVRVLEDVGNVQMGDVDDVELKKDEIAIVKYSNVDELIRQEKLELV